MNKTEAGSPVVCENYELSFGEEGLGVALTFALDDEDFKDISLVGLTHIQSLEVKSDGYHVGLASSESSDAKPQYILFPFEEGMAEVAASIKEEYGRIYVAALGPGKTPDSSTVIFAREMLLV